MSVLDHFTTVTTPFPTRRDGIVGIELVVQPPKGITLESFWKSSITWIETRYPKILSAVIHMDQKRPHMHVIVLPISEGRFAGDALSSGPNRFKFQREEFFAFIKRRLGMKRGRSVKTLGQLAACKGHGKEPAKMQRRNQPPPIALGALGLKLQLDNKPPVAAQGIPAHRVTPGMTFNEPSYWQFGRITDIAAEFRAICRAEGRCRIPTLAQAAVTPGSLFAIGARLAGFLSSTKDPLKSEACTSRTMQAPLVISRVLWRRQGVPKQLRGEPVERGAG